MNIPAGAEMRNLVCDDSQYEYVDPDVFDAWWEGQQSCDDTYPWEYNSYA